MSKLMFGVDRAYGGATVKEYVLSVTRIDMFVEDTGAPASAIHDGGENKLAMSTRYSQYF